jgi:hypothetical protein
VLDHVFALKVFLGFKLDILGSFHVVGLLYGRSSKVFAFKDTSLEGLVWVKKNLLGHDSLLVLEHLLAGVTDQAQLVDIQLSLIMIVFKYAQNTEGVTNTNIVFTQPTKKNFLLAASLSTRILEVIKPQDARDHTSRIINFNH